MDNERMAGRVGPTARRVADNIRRLRQEQGLDQQGLARRMTHAGHRTSVAQVSRVELGHRRVDVDDLMAFAVALNVSPSALLLSNREGEPTFLTDSDPVPWEQAWQWAAGDWPLRRDPYPDEDAIGDWIAANRPHDPVLAFDPGALRGHEEDMREVVAAIRRAEAGGLTRLWMTQAFRFFNRMDPDGED